MNDIKEFKSFSEIFKNLLLAVTCGATVWGIIFSFVHPLMGFFSVFFGIIYISPAILIAYPLCILLDRKGFTNIWQILALAFFIVIMYRLILYDFEISELLGGHALYGTAALFTGLFYWLFTYNTKSKDIQKSPSLLKRIRTYFYVFLSLGISSYVPTIFYYLFEGKEGIYIAAKIAFTLNFTYIFIIPFIVHQLLKLYQNKEEDIKKIVRIFWAFSVIFYLPFYFIVNLNISTLLLIIFFIYPLAGLLYWYSECHLSKFKQKG